MLFVGQLTAIYQRYPPHLIFHFDKFNWHLLMSGKLMVVDRGKKLVHQSVDGDPKANFSFLATITSEAQKIPLILIAKGTTVRCQKQFSRHNHHHFDSWHSSSGWSNKSPMLDDLDWLTQKMPPEPLCVLLDKYGTNPTVAMTAKTESSGIKLIWIPKVATGQDQRVDKRGSGYL
jgi:hypothetical protein